MQPATFLPVRAGEKSRPLNLSAAFILLTLMLLPLVSCAPFGESPPLAVDAPEGFARSGIQPPPDRWWQAFDDRQLNRLIEQALDANPSLEAAWHRFRQARALVTRESAALSPRLDARAEAELRSTEFEQGDQLLLGLFAEYEVDLWGRIRSRVEAERYRAGATLYDYRTAAISLSAEVAQVWFRWVAERNQLTLLREQLDTNRRLLELIRSRFRSGLVRSVDLLRQDQLVEATRELIIAGESRAEVLRHQLAVLLGRAPREDLAWTDRDLPDLPPLPQTGLPLDLLRRRPDLQRAYHLLRAADAELAAAISGRYPRLTLAASLSTAENRTEKLFRDWLATLAGNLLAPVFDADLREAEVERSAALRDERLFLYARETLNALREVEDALVRELEQGRRIASLERQVLLADRTSERLRQEYFHGFGDYIEVLRALTEQQELRRDLLGARRDLLEFRIALYRALAGGFTTHREKETE